ncbi:MAG: hypothetical protein HQK54_12315, partial [Oligoflexales bacterium]|nr:hypothetical protein [Oligoflexales bacterium]
NPEKKIVTTTVRGSLNGHSTWSYGNGKISCKNGEPYVKIDSRDVVATGLKKIVIMENLRLYEKMVAGNYNPVILRSSLVKGSSNINWPKFSGEPASGEEQMVIYATYAKTLDARDKDRKDHFLIVKTKMELNISKNFSTDMLNDVTIESAKINTMLEDGTAISLDFKNIKFQTTALHRCFPVSAGRMTGTIVYEENNMELDMEFDYVNESIKVTPKNDRQ